MRKSIKILTAMLFVAFFAALSGFCIYSAARKETVGAATSEISITSLGAHNDNIFILNTDGDASSAAKTYIKVYVNDEPKDVHIWDASANSITLEFGKTSFRLNDASYLHVRIPAGTVLGEAVLKEDYNFYNLYRHNFSDYLYVGQEETMPVTVNSQTGFAARAEDWYIALGVTIPEGSTIPGEIWNCNVFYATEEDDISGNYTLYGGVGNTVNVNRESDSVIALMVTYKTMGATSSATGHKRLYKIPAGTVWGGYHGKCRITETFYLLYDGSVFSFSKTDPSVVSKGITVENAKIKMGGEYTGAYYDFNGTWSDAGWFANATETSGDIYVKYNIEKETRTAVGTYGAARFTNVNTAANYPVTHGILDFISNGGTATWKNVANGNDILLKYDAAAHKRTLNGNIVWGWPQTETAGITATSGGDNGISADYATADALGAKWFGVAWNGGSYSLKASLQIYDADNNDLGVVWSTPNASVTSALCGKIGEKVYFASAFDSVNTVSVKTASGAETAVTLEENGVYSFVMPSEDVTITTTEKTQTTIAFDSLVNQTFANRFVMLLKNGAGDGTYGTEIASVTAKIDGAEKSVSFVNWGEGLAFLFGYDVLPASGYHTFEISAGQISARFIFEGVSINVADGEVVTPLKLEFTGSDYQVIADVNVYRYIVYFNDLGTGSAVTFAGNASVTVNDTDDTTAESYFWANGKLAILLPKDDYPVDKEFKITVNPCRLGSYYITEGVTIYAYDKEVTLKTEVTYTLNGANYTKAIVWGETGFNSVFSASIAETDGVKVIGYTYEDKLYSSLSKIYEKITENGEDAPKAVNFAVETIKLSNERGAYIRTNSDYQGLRFVTSVSEQKHANVTEYGMYFTSVSFLNSEALKGDFKKIENGVNGYKISSASANFNSWIKGDGYEYYSAVIDLSPVNYNKKFTVCAYVTVSYADGTSEEILAAYDSEANVRSAYEVASAAVEFIEDKTSSAYLYTQKYVEGVLDLDYDYNLIGAERSYTVEKLADGKVKLTAKDGSGFDVATVLAFCVNGERQSATFDNGTVTFEASLMMTGRVENKIEESGNGGKKLQILAYDGPSLGIHLKEGVLTNEKYRSSTVADIKKYFDAGFNYIVADEADFGAYRYEGIAFGSGVTGTKNDAERMLDLVALYCDEYGITDPANAPVIVYWSVIFSVMDKAERQNLILDGAVRTDDNVKQLIKNGFDELCTYVPAYPEGYAAKTNGTPLNCFKGFVLRDEPYGEDLDLYLQWYNYLASDLGMTESGYLLVGSVLSFGVEEKYVLSGSTSESKISDDKFVSEYLDKIVNGMAVNGAENGSQYVMADHYPFRTTLQKNALSNTVNATYYISDGYFVTMQKYATAAKAKGLKAGIAVQSVTHYNKSKFEALGSWIKSSECAVTGRIDESGNLIADENMIRYQAYMALCYGYERIDYFTYWEHYNSVAAETMRQSAVSWAYDSLSGEYVGVYQPTYEWIKKANSEIKNFESVLLAFDWQGTRLVTGTSATGNCFGSAESYSGNAVANTATALYDLAVGSFVLDDMNGYMIVNADDPINARSNVVTMNFGTDYEYAVCYIGGSPVVCKLTGGELSLTLGAGDGVFAVPVK